MTGLVLWFSSQRTGITYIYLSLFLFSVPRPNMSRDVARRETLRKFKLSTFPAAWAERLRTLRSSRNAYRRGLLRAVATVVRAVADIATRRTRYSEHLLSRLLTRKCIHPDKTSVPADREEPSSSICRRSSFSKLDGTQTANRQKKKKKRTILFEMDQQSWSDFIKKKQILN